jgi:hypothetical protein
MMKRAVMHHVARFLVAAVTLCCFGTVFGEDDAALQQLPRALQSGGHVLVISDARSSGQVPAEPKRAPANFKGEPEIDAYGQGQMAVIAYAFRSLRIPVEQTLTSPLYRSRQSANYLGFGKQVVTADLGRGDGAMRLAQLVATPTPAGTNTVIVTQASEIERVFGRTARDLATAETLVFRPADGHAEIVARLTFEDWAKLAVH